MYKPSTDTIRFFTWRYLYLPQHANTTPLFHYKIIDHYTSTGSNEYGLLQIFRGAGKSQLTIEYALYCLCEGIEQYVLFVGSTIEMASELVNTASDLAESIPYIKVTRRIDGTLEIINKNGEPAFMVAKSTNSKLRGIAKSGSGYHRVRPTMICLDDIVFEELVENPYRIKKSISWLYGSLFATLVPGGRVIGSGTPLRQGDPFMHLFDIHGGVKIPLEYGLWEDRFTTEWIDKKQDEYKRAGQWREYLREFRLELTDDTDKVFDIKKIDLINEEDVPNDLSWFITLDGAFSEKDSSDYSAFACVGLDSKGIWYVAMYDMKDKPQEVINKLFELQAKYRALDIGIEKGNFKLAMEYDINQKQLDYQQYFTIRELSVSGSKLSRIKALAPIVEARRMKVIDTGEPTERLLEQMDLISQEAINSRNDDHVDSLSQVIQMVPTYYGSNEVNLEDYYEPEEEEEYGGSVFSV